MDKKQKIITFAMAIGIFLCMLDTTIMNIALPKIQTGLNVSLENLSWALNIYTITFAVFTIPCARIADLLGKNKVYLIGLTAFLLGSLFSGSAPNAGCLIAARGIQSLGAAIIFPASMTIGISSVNIENRKTVLTVLGITQGLAAALGPTIGGIITQYLGWRYIFLINLPLIALAIILAASFLPLKNEKTIKAKIDLTGMLLSMLMLFSLTLILIKGNDWGWRSFPIIIFAATALLSLGLFIVIEKHSHAPMIPLVLFKDRQFVGASLAMILSGVFLVAVMVIMPTFFTTVLGKSELMAALMITPASLMIFLLSPIGGRMIETTGPRLMMLLGFLLMSAGYIVLSFVDPAYYSQLVISFILIGGGYGIIAGPIVVLGASKFTGELLTASQSVLGLFRQIGTLLAVAIFVSALTANLKTAKAALLKDADNHITASALPSASQSSFKESIRKSIKNGRAAKAHHSRTISSDRIKESAKTKYQRNLLHISNSSALPSSTKQKIYAAVYAKVKQDSLRQEQLIKRMAKDIKREGNYQLKKAFMKPYHQAVPFIILAGFSSLLFYRKKDYHHKSV
ncbi:transporter, major facilitator family protein [Liquorilactobacillus sucicola DSM 21376 = JCM 15457]|uniref:Transporter, major facilitator family protein n=2 Tax=Liquorilactobacillus sucicola TaxID=519050 RepID=A0A0R2E069_9LACO|nr:MFS transporter [Liquorilactobacillus sucicola]KRN06266.1 transporter, major facilitator family protein [Liquorilactobacillus sucicola DSM 21376 = JCM 15457]